MGRTRPPNPAGVGAEAVRLARSVEPVPGAVLLDVGCGAGEDVRALARRHYPFGGLLLDLR
jgi:ubiquinone/menaquinone biosynthesis C-methylase UbiE